MYKYGICMIGIIIGDKIHGKKKDITIIIIIIAIKERMSFLQ